MIPGTSMQERVPNLEIFREIFKSLAMNISSKRIELRLRLSSSEPDSGLRLEMDWR